MTEEPLRWRTATLAGVSFPGRTIELIVAPYEQEALVNQPYGRLVTETIARGAFEGIERRANRIRVNRDHDVTRTVGRAIAFYPSRQEGLVAELKIAQTELGDETLTLADDDCLDASAGFRPMPDGERWTTRTRVRITKAWLGHIAMTPDPAYTGANVLAVRNTDETVALPQGTPNLDEIRAWRLQQQYDLITR